MKPTTAMTKVLICFTASFPYGKRETYFENELLYLSQAFEQLVIIPRYNPSGSTKQRPVPLNVKVYPPLVPQGAKRIIRGVFNRAPLSYFMRDFFSYKVYRSKYKFLKWSNFFLAFRITYDAVRPILLEYPHAILYAYWAETPLFVTRLVKDYQKMVRMHGGDFYLNRNQNYLPLRQEIYDQSELLLPISKDIQQHLLEYYHIPQQKIFLSYLGVSNNFNRFDLRKCTEAKPIVLVSCSNLVPLKRVDLILTALQQYQGEKKIIWHHFGDGSEMAALRQRAASIPEQLKIVFHGWVGQASLLNFYNENYVSWFINVSQFEGLPVSIMEAFSAAIPVIATNVGGTAEIVNNENGILLDGDVTSEDLLSRIINFDHGQYVKKSRCAYETWKSRFNASINYNLLTQKMQQL